MPYKLFIPGPIQVSQKTYAAMATPVVGHRSKDFVALMDKVQPGLKKVMSTNDPVYISTSSSWGVMEGSLRNVCGRAVLNCANGAFADKWFDVSKRCGKEAEILKFDWGKPVCPDALKKALSTGKFDAVTIIHNETSTGTMSDLPALMAVLREFPDVVSIVDTVSSLSVLPIKKDELGIDVLVSGCQKAFALPPGIAFLSVSNKAMERAKSLEGRGYYFDFLEFQGNFEKSMTPSTPAISLIYALASKLEEFEAEGLENRFARHAKNNRLVREWAFAKGFELLPEEKYASLSLNCFKNTLNIDVASLIAELKKRFKMVFDGGYGKLKGNTFRISNMGDETPETMRELLSNIDAILPEFLNK